MSWMKLAPRPDGLIRKCDTMEKNGLRVEVMDVDQYLLIPFLGG